MEVSDSDVSALGEWIALHPYLPQDRDDYFLKCIITATKGSIQQAKIRFDNFHKAMQDFPLTFQPQDLLYSEKSIRFNKLIAVYLFPKKTKENRYQIVATRLLDKDRLKDFDILLYTQRIAIAPLINIWDRNYGTGEFVLIVDHEGITLDQITPLANSYVLAAYIALNKSCPGRIKAAHIINMQPYAEFALNLVRGGLSEKMKARVHFHSSYKDLHRFFAKEDLPEEYGGSGPPITEMHELYMERVKLHHDKVLQESKNRAEEVKLRRHDGEIMTDTFRKLQID